MKTTAGLLLLLAGLGAVREAEAASTIDAVNKFAYGANIGWLNGRADLTNGAVIGEYVCAGYIWAANAGWIGLGSGNPTNGIHYQNLSANDFGVNHDGLGNLRGFAWGANIGWLNFENLGAPRVDLLTGRLSGSVWSANCGWISLSNAVAFVQTDHLQPGADTDGDGIADAWEFTYTNTLTAFTATSDTDGDGASDKEEYLADTNPLDPNSSLRITANSVAIAGGTESDSLTWNSRSTRQYVIQSRTSLDATNGFTDASGLLSPDGGTTTTRIAIFPTAAPQRFFRVEALRPLP